MIDRFHQFLTADCFSLSRRDFLTTSAAVAGGLAITPIIGSDRAAAAPLKEVRFSEAVHNLGYINLYVGMHAGIFAKNGLREERPRHESERRRRRHPDLRGCSWWFGGLRDR